MFRPFVHDVNIVVLEVLCDTADETIPVGVAGAIAGDVMGAVGSDEARLKKGCIVPPIADSKRFSV